MLFPGLFLLLVAATWLPGMVLSSPAAADEPLVTPLEVSADNNSSKIVVAVGKGSFSFTPNTITANPGDEIVFEFWSRGHSVARSAFGFPCMPYEYILTDQTGFWSGFMDDVTPTERPTFSITVNDTEPVFFYCAALDSCKENRMIGVINPNSTWTFAEQDSFINPRVIELRPGDPLPSESNRTTATNPAADPSAAAPPADDNDDGDDTAMPTLTDGEIAGVAMSSVALVILIAALAFTCIRQSKLEKRRRKATKHLYIKPSPIQPQP
ncbi:hypothetical protein NPX13_g9122 [Xylaria arbuscula]|uniref:Extracellular serine-rich protein n=1 Tax=Xylaria arbuscula TaxID=114810 RepID=A0A9W8TJ72_9PEZI|nr:hypothetical protein NPX13_g9122 [Xylaria arbuscula]